MKIKFLGTASGLAVVERANAAIYIEAGEEKWLLDCGEGCIRALLKYNIPANDIKGVIITHTHPDHCSGLPLLMQYMHLTERSSDFEIFLPMGAGAAFTLFFQQLYIIDEAYTYDYHIHEYDSGRVFIKNDFQIEAIPNMHLEKYRPVIKKYDVGIKSFSLLLKEKGNLQVYYSADLLGMKDLKAPQDADLMIVECMHVKPAEALEYAERKGIKQVIFTHVPPEVNPASMTLNEVTADFAVDGTMINVE